MLSLCVLDEALTQRLEVVCFWQRYYILSGAFIYSAVVQFQKELSTDCFFVVLATLSFTTPK